ncbi:sigma factor-like helix-turn-helix DNA-binding protein [Actinomycetes bacterium KLBMP 9759]
MVVLERLSPPQRVAFVLHEVLDLPYAEIGDVLGCSATAARQHAARARRIVESAPAPPRASSAEQEKVLARFADAVANADTAALVELMHPDAVWLTDSDGRTKAARRPVVGADKVVRLILGLLETYGADMTAGWEPVLVNGELGIRSAGAGEVPPSIAAIAVEDGRVTGIYQVLNPAKLPGRGEEGQGRCSP